MKVVEIKDACKIYGKGETKVDALNHVNVSIEEGEFVAILGTSGSGKSTMLNMIGGLDELTSGEIFLDGQNLKGQKDEIMSKFRREKLGFIFQSFNLIPVLSVYENIVMPVMLDNKKVDDSYIEELMELLGIKEKKNVFPNQLSGGQQQRVAIARALANKPRIVLADEPTGNLDTNNGQEVLKLLMNGVKKYNQTLIMVTHNNEIAKKADRIIFIENGAIKEDKIVNI
ncbi:MAG: ABC transporter ATP-binding protein [Bacillota bacterium]|nr:ABC transporter ATP-binding protein [Bacillota bacterium]